MTQPLILTEGLATRYGKRPASPGLRVRPLSGGDHRALEAIFAGLSLHSRWLRYHSPAPRLPPAMAARLLDLDGHDRVGLVAEVPGRQSWLPIATARLVRTGPRRAELSIEVVDAWQRRGVGTRLLRELKQIAQRLGYRTLDAELLTTNRAAFALLRTVFPDATVSRHGIESVVTCDLPARKEHLP